MQLVLFFFVYHCVDNIGWPIHHSVSIIPFTLRWYELLVGTQGSTCRDGTHNCQIEKQVSEERKWLEFMQERFLKNKSNRHLAKYFDSCPNSDYA